MKFALAIVVVIGVAIGASMPAPTPRPVAAAPAAPAERDDTRRPTVLQRGDGGHFWATVEVNGQPVRFIVDTGASTVALSVADARKAGVAFDPARFEPIGQGAGGVVRGEVVTLGEVALDGKEATGLKAVVLDGGEISLLGQNFLRIMNVEIKGDTMTLNPG
ncbi:retropepsin-like aspartic protease family protein [Sphingomonas lenta]|uniref:TIGR02281 family clan AA aspartic protease n=1 Tax=Sphingomonas lenta TaxID=1141887 RepID=A0A2A2SCE6_9SPHN|nr:TIGR02281 family clan AA aspartic protease [Sphingomonas lenta]PAX06928.1 TIGR02281 family clan AA aspartic protease [Sphingomonas lenta]